MSTGGEKDKTPAVMPEDMFAKLKKPSDTIIRLRDPKYTGLSGGVEIATGLAPALVHAMQNAERTLADAAYALSKIAPHIKHLNKITEELDKVQEKLERNKEELDKVQEKLERNKEELDKVQEKLDKEKLDKNKEELSKDKEQLDKNKKKLGQVQTALAKVYHAQTALTAA